MFRYPDGTFRKTLPSTITVDATRVPTASMPRSVLDQNGYNEAVALKKEPFTTYTTAWVKGEDLILREVVVEAVVDAAAKETAAVEARKQEITAELAALDTYLPRALEDILEGSAPVSAEHLSSYNQDRLAQKQSLRAELATL